MRRNRLLADEDGVSPVVGAVLLVAITVILAGVTATVVFGIGASSPAPNAQIEITSENKTFTGRQTDQRIKKNVLRITHRSGDSIDTENIRVLIEGHRSDNLYGIEQRDNKNDILRGSKYDIENLTAGKSFKIVFISDKSYKKGDEVVYCKDKNRLCGIGGPAFNPATPEYIESGDKVTVTWTSDSTEKSYVLAEKTIGNETADNV